MSPEEIEKAKRAAMVAAFLQKPIYTDSARRFLENDEVVEFIDFNYTAENISFKVKNRIDCELWYNQFHEVFFDLDGVLYSGTLSLKNGYSKEFANIKLEDFENLLKNKKFKVEVVPDLYKINNRYFQENNIFISKGEALDIITNKFKEYKWKDVEGQYTTGRMYSITEID